MNGNDQVEVHYMENGCYSYPLSEGFLDFFDVALTAPLNYLNLGQMHDQESVYWSMHMNSYKYGQSDGIYYGLYEDNGISSRTDFNRRVSEYSSMATTEDPITVGVPSEQNTVSAVHSIPEEREPNDQDAATAQPLPKCALSKPRSCAIACKPHRRVQPPRLTIGDRHYIAVPVGFEPMTYRSRVTHLHRYAIPRRPHVSWQDDIDPDTMTYEELLDLGEAVGTQSRGLSQELINLLPTSKHKSGGIFSRKKSVERCVICLMRYKRGDRKINLPCKHAYHTDCGSKWLSINKTCPVCNCVVFGDDHTTI